MISLANFNISPVLIPAIFPADYHVHICIGAAAKVLNIKYEKASQMASFQPKLLIVTL